MSTRKLTRKHRTERDSGESREDRQMSDRSVVDDRQLTDSERLDMFRQSFFQSSLPDLPKIPGYHTCWLTTTNPRDPIHGRLRIGYELIQASEIPGWENASIKSAEYEGCIGVNEMVAAKLPSHLYEAYMRESHHDQPLSEEEKLTIANQVIQEEANAQTKRHGAVKPIMMEAGNEALAQSAPPVPNFSSDYGED